MSLPADPLVSIALCTYNGEKFLREQLDSLVAQTYTNLEVIVCDDRSQDSTPDILKEYQKSFPGNFEVHVNESNLGFLRNFEKAIGLCHGEFIALADQDDIWFPEKIEILVRNIGNNLLIYSDSEIIDMEGRPKNKKLSEVFRFIRGKDFRKLIFHNCVSGHTMMFRKELREYALPFPDTDYHDWWLAFAATAAGSIDYVDDVLVKYRMHGENMSETHEHAFKVDEIRSRKKKKKSERKRWRSFRNNRMEIRKLDNYRNFRYYRPEDRDFMPKFVRLMRERENQILSFQFFWLWYKYGDSLLYASRSPASKKKRFILRKIIGMGPKKVYYKLRGKYNPEGGDI